MWTLYLPYAAYVPVLGAEYFQIPCRIIFDRFLAEDEQKTKLVSAHSSLTSFQNSFPNKKGWFKTAQQTWNLAHTLHEQKIWVQDFTPNIAWFIFFFFLSIKQFILKKNFFSSICWPYCNQYTLSYPCFLQVQSFILPQRRIFYTHNVRASVKNSMSAS